MMTSKYGVIPFFITLLVFTYLITTNWARLPGLVFVNVGNVNLLENNPTQSNKWFHNALKLDDNSAPALHGLGRVYENQGKYDEAIEVLQRGYDLDPKNLILTYKLGKVYEKDDQAEHALKIWSSVELIEPMWGLGKKLRENNQLDTALLVYKSIIDIDPSNGTAYRLLGDVWKQMGNQDKAMSLYRQGILADPDNIWLYVGVGNVYREDGNYLKAQDLYYQAHQIDSRNDWPLYLLGVNSIYWGRVQEGCNYLEMALDINSDNTGANKYYELHCK